MCQPYPHVLHSLPGSLSLSLPFSSPSPLSLLFPLSLISFFYFQILHMGAPDPKASWFATQKKQGHFGSLLTSAGYSPSVLQRWSSNMTPAIPAFNCLHGRLCLQYAGSQLYSRAAQPWAAFVFSGPDRHGLSGGGSSQKVRLLQLWMNLEFVEAQDPGGAGMASVSIWTRLYPELGPKTVQWGFGLPRPIWTTEVCPEAEEDEYPQRQGLGSSHDPGRDCHISKLFPPRSSGYIDRTEAQ